MTREQKIDAAVRAAISTSRAREIIRLIDDSLFMNKDKPKWFRSMFPASLNGIRLEYRRQWL